MLIAVLEKNVSFIIIFGTLFPYRPGIFNLWSATPRGASRGPRATPEKLETRRILTKQNTGHINAVGTGYTYRIENFAGVCYAMSFWPKQEYERLKPVRLGPWGPPPELRISVGSTA